MKSCADAFTEVNQMKVDMVSVVKKNKLLKDQNKELNKKLLNLEYHQKRNNLLFDSFEEVRSETDENCKDKILSLITKLPGSPEKDNIKIAHCQRHGRYLANKNRNIIVNFHRYGDRQFVLQNRKHLPKGIYVRRKILRPILKLALKIPCYQGKVRLQWDKLVEDGKEYSYDTLDQLPQDIKLAESCQREKENVAFPGLHSPLSNLFKCNFTVDNVEYNCTEQYIQSEKCALFDDDDPFRMMALGRKTRNYNHHLWKSRCKSIALKCNSAKFEQNSGLKYQLSQTKQKLLRRLARTIYGERVRY